MDFEDEGSFGDLLARYRTRTRKSQQHLADCLGVHRSTVVKWEQKGSLPKDRARIEEIVRCLKLTEHQRDVLLRAALLNIPHIIWNIPYPRNPFFTGRDQELARLHAQLQQRNTAAVGQTQSISGLGGIGKTQIAVEYAYRYCDEYDYVLWARAESIETLNSSYIELARLLDLPEKDAQKLEITIQAVKRWLQRQRGWLLILDNADSPGLLPAFLPSTVGGHLLITTRAADLSAQIAGLDHPLLVEIFSDEQGALFLLHRSDLLIRDATLDQAETHARQLAMEISHELGGLPLALDQAGAYLKATSSSLVLYQQIYRHHRAQLLKERRGADHPEPVATTWDISFSNIEQQNPTAANLLRLCAFLAPDAIPEEIITEGAEELGVTIEPVADPLLFNGAIESLRAYSLITRDPQEHTLAVHRLVQAVLRDSMPVKTQQQWMLRAVHAVATAYPESPDVANWSTFERLLPHARTCVTWIEQTPIVTPEASFLLNATAYYLDDRAQYEEAEPLLKRALAIREQGFGLEHLATAQSLNNLAMLYKSQGRYREAEPLLKRALAIREQQLGAEHPDTATSLNNLAMLYQSQGRYREAEPLIKRALAIREQQLGAEHPGTATCLCNLAALYATQGKYEEAEVLYLRALAIFEQELGATHPDTALSLNSLATLYHEQGKYGEAELLYQRALVIHTKVYGAEHPSMALDLNNLAALYDDQGKYREAEVLYLRALAIREQRLGPEHPDTAQSLNNLAILYKTQEKYEEAEVLYLRALAIFEQELGATHPDTASSLNNLAAFYYTQGRYGEAEPLLKRALAIREQESTAMHTDTASCLNNLAFLYMTQGRYEEAEPLYQRALAIYELILGRQHPNTQTTRQNYITLLRTMGRDAETKKPEKGL